MITKEMINDHPAKYLIKFDNPVGMLGYEFGLMETVNNIDDLGNQTKQRIIHPFSPITGVLHVGIMIKMDDAIKNGYVRVI